MSVAVGDSRADRAVRRSRVGRGVALCCLSAVLFGLLGPLGVKAFAVGISVNSLLAWRFGLAALLLTAVVVATRRPWGRGRRVWQPLLMGAVLYAGQSALYFGALQRLPVGLTSLLLYMMPVMVVLVSVFTRREAPRVLTFVALALSVGGVGLALLGPAQAGITGLGILLGLGSAVVYTCYFLSMEALPNGTDRLAASALICTGGALSHAGVGLLRGTFDPTPAPAALAWIAVMAIVATVLAISLLMVGIVGAGAARGSVVSCLEPITAVLLGAAFFADPFGLPQIVGAGCVVAAVVLLSLRQTHVEAPPPYSART